MPHIPSTYRPLIERTILFVGLFAILSGSLGPHIISGGIMGRDGFAIYGGLGKVFLFFTCALTVLVWQSPRHLPAAQRLQPNRTLAYDLAGSLSAAALVWYATSSLISGQRQWPLVFLAHAGIIIAVLLALSASFGWAYLGRFYRAYRQSVTVATAAAAGFFVLLELAYAAWPLLATAVMHAVAWLLNLSGLAVQILPPRTLLLDKFGVSIAQYCSGVESIALFSGLYAFIGLLDYRRFNFRRFAAVFPVALLVLFACNILRVYSLILAGYYINARIAFSLFHTYAGMLFFIVYAGIFWLLAYRWLLARPAAASQQASSPRIPKP